MSQPIPRNPDISQLLGPALGGIVHALADRGCQTEAEYKARSIDAWTLVVSFQPRDAIDLTLTGQFITMNELFADNARDVLRGMSDAPKQRALSSAIAMSRLALAQVSELDRRGVRPYRTEATPEPRPAQYTPTSEPAKETQPATPAPPPSDEPQKPASEDARPDEEASWVDEPYEERLDETPAMRAAATATVPSKAIPQLVTDDARANADVPTEIGLQPPQAAAVAAAA